MLLFLPISRVTPRNGYFSLQRLSVFEALLPTDRIIRSLMRNSRSLFILNAWGCKSSEGDQGNGEFAALINLPGWLLPPPCALQGLQVSDGLCNCRIDNKPAYVLGNGNEVCFFGHYS